MSEEQVEISPSQLAIDSLAKKNRELEEVISFEPVDIKKLQLRLQGSVLVTVNAGSMAYAYAFLANNDEKLISSKEKFQLKCKIIITYYKSQLKIYSYIKFFSTPRRIAKNWDLSTEDSLTCAQLLLN